jgi:hypothetical protein
VNLDILDQVDQGFSIGVARKLISPVDQLFFEREVILDNAIMDDGQVFRLGIMRMGIDIIGFAVRCPTGVCDADYPLYSSRYNPFIRMG